MRLYRFISSFNNNSIKRRFSSLDDSSIHQYRIHLDSIGRTLKINKIDDWYQVKYEDFISSGGRKLVDVFEGNFENLLVTLYPEQSWNLWRFKKLSSSTILSTRDLIGILENLIAPSVGVKSIEDWYEVSQESLSSSGFSWIIKPYDNILSLLLRDIYPNYPWLIWKFKEVPSTFWKDIKNQRIFLDHFSSSFSLSSLDDWYHVKINDIKKLGGQEFLKIYGNSFARGLSIVYPDHNWDLNLFRPDVWKDSKNQRTLFNRISKSLQLEQWEDWYQVQIQSLKPFYGVTDIITKQYGSLASALPKIYSEYKWQFWKFQHFPPDLWKEVTNQRLFLDSIAFDLGYQSMDDWYNLTKEDIRQQGGHALLRLFNEDVKAILVSAFPERTWDFFRFTRGRGFWTDEKVHRNFFDALSKELRVKSWEDWYRVKLSDVYRFGGSTLLSHYYNGSLIKALSHVYPEHPWELHRSFWIKGQPSKSQMRLWSALTEIFPNVADIHMEYILSELRFLESNKPIEMDIFIPSFKLALEYHGEQHYRDTPLMEDIESRSRKDEEKRGILYTAGITLIEIPFWWDGGSKSLKATIHRFRPDLVPDPGNEPPIPLDQNGMNKRQNFSIEST